MRKVTTKSEHFWLTCIVQTVGKFSKQVKFNLTDCETVAYLYEQVGGGWEDLAGGDPEAWNLLRLCVKVYLKRKLHNGKQ